MCTCVNDSIYEQRRVNVFAAIFSCNGVSTIQLIAKNITAKVISINCTRVAGIKFGSDFSCEKLLDRV